LVPNYQAEGIALIDTLGGEHRLAYGKRLSRRRPFARDIALRHGTFFDRSQWLSRRAVEYEDEARLGREDQRWYDASIAPEVNQATLLL
jgi:hypothetical protein